MIQKKFEKTIMNYEGITTVNLGRAVSPGA